MFDEPVYGIEEEQLVVFRLGGDYFAMLIAAVNEIIPMQKITHVPRSPEFVEGVTSFRGKVIPVIDLRKRIGIDFQEAPTRRIIVLVQEDKLIGMIVDSVDEVLSVPTAIIEAPDQMVVSVDSEFITGIVRLEDRLIILLDHEQVLTPSELSQLGNLKVGSRALKEAQTQELAEAAEGAETRLLG